MPDSQRPGAGPRIPDGGLQNAMPDWLRRPPAWRNVPKQESSAVQEAVAQAAPEPAEDQSPIDPTTLVDISDLPQWLQDIAARPTPVREPTDTASAPKETTQETAATVIVEQQETDDMPNEVRLEKPPTEDRTVKFEPTTHEFDAPAEETKTYGGGKPMGGMNMPMIMAGVVLLLLIIFALVIFL